MTIDYKKIKIVKATPPELKRAGPGFHSPLTKMMQDMEPGDAFGIPTEGAREHKIQQRAVNSTAKRIIAESKDNRAYVTRTLKAGDKLGNITLKDTTLGIYRTK